MTEDELRAHIRALLQTESYRKLAARLGVSHNVISHAVHKRGPVAPALAAALGYRREVRYVHTPTPGASPEETTDD